MESTILVLNAITWPIAALVFGVAAAFGGLNKPLKAVSEAFGGIFKDLRNFRDELSAVDTQLKKITEVFPETLKKLETHVESLEKMLATKLKDITVEIQETKDRVTQEGLTQETGIDLESINEEKLLSKADAKIAIEKIVSSWANIKEAVEKRFPDATHFDKREYGQAFRQYANKKPLKAGVPQLVNDIASLHSRFKGFTRRKAYAEEWLTDSLLKEYISDAAKLIEKLKDN